MGYRTPNIDRLAKEGMMFTDSYGEQSCTAGRASFITGQSGFRTGLTKVGLPGADVGLQAQDATIAELLKPLGYATGQFGKNHLGDRNNYLPTVHGFDEFFGNLYHLNAEEDPEDPDYPTEKEFPQFNKLFRPRGVLHCFATDKDDPDCGPALRPRRQAEDQGHRSAHAQADGDRRRRVRGQGDRLHQAPEQGRYAVLLLGQLHPHASAHAHQARECGPGRTLAVPYHDTMIDHDKNVGSVLDALDKLGLAEDTLVVYSTDNGPHMNSWPDGAMTPFRSEKDTNWEGAFRIPELVRWPGKIPAGVVSNEIVQHHDWLPTFLAIAGEPNIVEKLKKGHNDGRQDVQEPHRRLQPAAFPYR